MDSNRKLSQGGGIAIVKAKRFLSVVLLSVSMALFCGCQGDDDLLDPRNPVTLTLWHNYGGQMKNTMDKMIDEFNATVGAEKGIIINVTSISGSASLHEKLIMAAYGDPGAPELPDISTAYPKTALILAEKGLLIDLGEQFSEEELAAYLPRFLEEGRIKDGKLYVFPIAKSTEVFFVNKTIFNKFASETGIGFKDLDTIEGIIRAAEKYYQWTDSQTPDIPHDGKTFFMVDSLFNFTLVGCKQLACDFINDNQIDCFVPAFSRVWDCFCEPVLRGYVAIFDGYSTDLIKTGDIVCYTGSTAGVAFLPARVTYPDNTTEPTDFAILPYPIFEGGKKIAVQRGAGFCVLKSTKEKEYAAGIFLKWFTKPEQNLKFVLSTGYLPVTLEAFDRIMAQEIEAPTDDNIRKLLDVAVEMQQNYDFYIPPVFEGIDALEKQYEQNLKRIAKSSRSEFLKLIQYENPDTAYSKVSEGVFEQFIHMKL